MSFASFLSLSLLFVCAGVIFGCTVRIFIRYFHFHASAGGFWTTFCIFLSLAVATFASSLIFNRSFLGELSLLRPDLVFFASLAAASAVICIFWKVLLPVFAVLYTSLTVLSLYVLHQRFDSQKAEHTVTLKTQEIIFDDQSFSYDKSPVLYFQVTKLPHSLLIPVRHSWFLPVDSAESQSDTSTPLFSGLPSFLKPCLLAYEQWMLSSTEIMSAEIPDSSFKPALYTLTIFSRADSLDFEVKRSL